MDLLDILFYLILPTVILGVILYIIYKTSKEFRSYLGKNYSEIIVNIIIVVWSVFVGALFAIQFTKGFQKDENEKNYLSMLNSCKNMNEHYLKNVNLIINCLASDSYKLEELKYLTKNIDDPFLLREILQNSELYQYSSEDFRNWLPEIISFLTETNWIIEKKYFADYEYRFQYLLLIKSMLENEEKYIKEELCDDEVKILNNSSRKELEIFNELGLSKSKILDEKQDTKEINSNFLDIRIKQSVKEGKDSNTF